MRAFKFFVLLLAVACVCGLVMLRMNQPDLVGLPDFVSSTPGLVSLLTPDASTEPIGAAEPTPEPTPVPTVWSLLLLYSIYPQNARSFLTV